MFGTSVGLSTVTGVRRALRVLLLIAATVWLGLPAGLSEEVDTAERAYLDSREVSRADDARLAGLLASALHLDRTLEPDAESEPKVRAVTSRRCAVGDRFLDRARRR